VGASCFGGSELSDHYSAADVFRALDHAGVWVHEGERKAMGFLARLMRELTSDELGKFSSEAMEGVLRDPSRDFHSLRQRIPRLNSLLLPPPV
jgi:hypothetical protein